MSNSNPYQTLVSRYAELVVRKPDTASQPLMPSAYRALPKDAAAKALVFSPHPDDECIVGGLPLRLLREHGVRVMNVAVTLGSNQNRQVERWHELQQACDYLSFSILATAERGLDAVTLEIRAQQAQRWLAAVNVITEIIATHTPAIVFFPHDNDWNHTHIATHFLLLDALAQMPPEFTCLVVETEFWGAMAAPNMLVESSTADVTDLVSALSLHRGEVARNPYHLRLPAWMIDNVRRGAELVSGQGEAAPSFAFATLYRLRRWANGQLHPVQEFNRVIAQNDKLGVPFTF